MMNNLIRPEHLPFDTPEVSPVLAQDVSRLPPQLIFYADTEILMTDSTRWIKRCRDAGVRMDVHVGKGEMHTYSNGTPVASSAMEAECDDVWLNYMFTELAPPV
jgi:acetyl esterase/lipase